MYPEITPELDVSSERGLNDTQLKALSCALKECAEENIGMPMVFTLAEAAKEWLQERNVESKGDGSAFERMQQRKQEVERAKLKEAQVQEEKEKRKNELKTEKEKKTRQVLVVITKDEFFEWRDQFESEMESVQAASKRSEKVRLTGKQIFQMGLQSGGASSVRAAERAMENAEEERKIDEDIIDPEVFDGENLDELLDDDLLDGIEDLDV
jgi:hypothetical protein